jgi:hypothetical protein
MRSTLAPFAFAAFAALAAFAASASCAKHSVPPEGSDPAITPGTGTTGGAEDGSVDALALDAGEGGAFACGLAPTILEGFTPTRVVFVAPDGSDGNDGLSRTTAWRSLANASKLAPGDRVDLFAGTYPCAAVIGVHGDPAHPLWIRSADGPRKAKLDCGGATYGIEIAHGHYIAIDGLDMTGAQLDLIHIDSGDTPFTDPSDHILILNNHLHDSGASAVRATQSTNIDIVGNEVHHPEAFGPQLGGEAIDLVAVSGARVVFNRVYDVLSNTAISVRGGAFSTLVAGNVISDVQDAIHLGGVTDRSLFLPADSTVEATGVVAHSNVIFGATSAPLSALGCLTCIFANNSIAITTAQAGVRALPGAAGQQAASATSHTSGLVIANNLFAFSAKTPTNLLQMGADDQSGFTQSHNLFFLANGNAGSIASDVPISGAGTVVDRDPLFTNATTGDLTLGAGSPARLAGVPVANVTFDATGACKTTWNIGAF